MEYVKDPPPPTQNNANFVHHGKNDKNIDLTHLSNLCVDLKVATSTLVDYIHFLDTLSVDWAKQEQLHDLINTAYEKLAFVLEHLNAGTKKITQTRVQALDLHALLHSIHMYWHEQAAQRNKQIVLHKSDDLPLFIFTDHILFEHSVNTAIAHTLEHAVATAIHVDVTLDSDRVRIAISDGDLKWSNDATTPLSFERDFGSHQNIHFDRDLALYLLCRLANVLDMQVAVFNVSLSPQKQDNTQGTAVVLTLPITETDKKTLSNAQSEHAKMPFQGYKILLTDNKRTEQFNIAFMLQDMGAHVTLAGDGVETLYQIKNGDFDIALLSHESAFLSGLDVIRILRKMPPLLSQQAQQHSKTNLPVFIVLVEQASRDLFHTIYQAGADGIISKPIPTPGHLRKLLHYLLNLKHVENSNTTPQESPVVPIDFPTFKSLMFTMGVHADEFIDGLNKDLHRMRNRLSAVDMRANNKKLQKETQSLVSLANTIGAQQLEAAAERLVSALYNKKDDCLDRALHSVLNEMDILLNYLKNSFGKLKATLHNTHPPNTQ